MTLLTTNIEDLVRNPEKAYNKYQTIITTPYRLDMQPKANNNNAKHFVIDKRYLKMIDGLSNGNIK